MHELLHLRKILEETAQARADNLAAGAAKDYAGYQRVVGEITGLSLALREINDLLKRLSDANGDLDDE